MPLVDGALSTRMIRYHEKDFYEKELRDAGGERLRVPIIAVSAKLFEDHRYDYIQSGYVVLTAPLSTDAIVADLTIIASMDG